MARINKKQKHIILAFFVYALLLIPYGKMIFSLSLFGDATIHANITRGIIEKGLFSVSTTYPPVYNITQVIFYSIFGEIGFNLLVFLSLIFLIVSIYLLAKALFNNYWISLISGVIVITSSKIIFFTARMYMEILLSAFIVITIYFFLKYLKEHQTKYIILTGVFCGITASIKQQGLFILFAAIFISLLLFLLFNKYTVKFSRKILLKGILLFLTLFLLVIILPYLWLFNQSGKIIIGNEDYAIIKITNDIGKRIVGYEEDSNVNDDEDEKWTPILKDIRKSNFSQAYERAENRHIFPIDVFISWEKFHNIHGLHYDEYRGMDTSAIIANTMSFMLVFGILLYIYFAYKRNKIIDISNPTCFVIFISTFLIINYLLFERNTDQVRYHVFISIIFSVFAAFAIYLIFRYITTFLKDKNINIAFPFAVFLILNMVFNSLIVKTSLGEKLDQNQIYSSSIGGIDSIKEVGLWIQVNADVDSILFQNCGNELKYYSQRNVNGGWEYYFLNEEQLREIFKDKKIDYIVIYESQLVNDEKWEHHCWVPQSFKEKVDNEFNLVYTSSYGDIYVYSVE